MQNYNDHGSQSSESDIEQDHIYKATTGYGKIAKITKNKQHYSSSSSEESPLSDDQEDDEEEEINRPQDHKKIHEKVDPIYQRASSSEESDEEDQHSIDHIEERIKRLEQDLEKKIDKHKQESVGKERPQTAIVKDHGKNIKNSASPPLPKKMETKNVPIAKTHNEPKQHKISKEPEEKIAEVEQYLPPTKKEFKHVEQVIEEQKQAKDHHSPRKKHSKDKKEEQAKNPSVVVPEKKRIESKGNAKPEAIYHHSPESAAIKKLNKANKQIEQLTKALEQSKKQNKRLKEQLSHSKKKKTLQQVQKLKEIAAESNDVKLQKQIQLLKIIEGLQTKLKKSINKKLGKSRAGSTSAALLHKGLPSSLIH